MIVFLTGASGVGKTSIVEKLDQDFQNCGFTFHHFDSIEIPSAEEIRSIKNWQETTTHEWIDRLVAREDKDVIVFEGSTIFDLFYRVLKNMTTSTI
ncbi:MAG: ATP-binding protein [Saprospiraceae bacterium]|nr:ATP-binding protein [Saprospiraceae bacterium]